MQAQKLNQDTLGLFYTWITWWTVSFKEGNYLANRVTNDVIFKLAIRDDMIMPWAGRLIDDVAVEGEDITIDESCMIVSAPSWSFGLIDPISLRSN